MRELNDHETKQDLLEIKYFDGWTVNLSLLSHLTSNKNTDHIDHIQAGHQNIRKSTHTKNSL